MVATADDLNCSDSLQHGQVFVIHDEELVNNSINVILNHIRDTFNGW